MKYPVIMWELSLRCNLDCDFCYQQERRKLQTSELTKNQVEKIIDHLPADSHIAFIGGESFLFPGFMDILHLLDDKGISYEITTNGTFIEKFLKEINSLNRLTNINFSVDFMYEKQDKYRKYPGLFSKITRVIPKLRTKVNINTVIFQESEISELVKLHLFFSQFGIYEHTFLMYSSFTREELDASQEKVPEINVKTSPEQGLDYPLLRKKSVQFFKQIFEINKKLQLRTKVILIPQGLLVHRNSCKHLDNQYRINEDGKLSICHYIDNAFGSLVEDSFEDIINNHGYLTLKAKIQENFPLDICKNCCKLL